MAISRVVFWYFIIELVTRNPILGMPPLEGREKAMSDQAMFARYVWRVFKECVRNIWRYVSNIRTIFE